jgi:hypothetical protein
MFTAQSLLADALNHEVVYRTLLEQFPSGTYNEERNLARRKMDDAFHCAFWIEKQGHVEIPNVGPFMTIKPVKGQLVRLKRGSVIFGTGSGIPEGGKTTIRAQTIKVHYIDEGYVDRIDREPKLCQGKIHWVGPNGYWRWSDINNFELIDLH